MQRIIFTCKSPDSPENRFQYHRQLNILEASFGSKNHFTHVLLIFLIDGHRVYYRVRFLSKPTRFWQQCLNTTEVAPNELLRCIIMYKINLTVLELTGGYLQITI